MGKSTISMVIFNSYVKLPEGTGIDKIKSLKLIERLNIDLQYLALATGLFWASIYRKHQATVHLPAWFPANVPAN